MPVPAVRRLDRRHVLTYLYIVVGAIYLGWRSTTLNLEAPIFSGVFYGAELYGYLMSLVIIYISWQLKFRQSVPAPAGISVDVFIPTYNEPLQVVRRTVLGALRMDYPHETWLLDDGNRTDMRALAKELGCHYLAREKNIDAKAGNLNNGLRHAKGHFIALFDADHVAEKDFLLKTLGYFNDPAVAFVQTPQDYYNTDSYQHGRDQNKTVIWHEQSSFHYVGQTGRDARNAASLCGCSAVLRRQALDEIGGFATGTVTEDMHTSVRIQKLGYKSVFHPEPLAFGIAPHNLRDFLRQRLRWGEGNLQVCREEGLPFSRKLSFAQRLAYFGMTATYLDGWQKLVYYAAPIVVLFFHVPPIWASPTMFAAFFVPYFLLAIIYFEEFGRGSNSILATEKFAMSRFAYAILATLGIFRKNIKFRVTSKRLLGEFPLALVTPHIAVFTLSLGAIAYTFSGPAIRVQQGMPESAVLFVCFWAVINMLFAAAVIRDAVRSSNRGSADYRFEIPLPIKIYGSDIGWRYGTVQSICSSEMSFVAHFPSSPDIQSPLKGEIFLPSGAMKFWSVVKSSQPITNNGAERNFLVDCTLLWDKQSSADELDLTLISSKWHRRILNKHEQVPTLLQKLTSLFKVARRDDLRHPVLYQTDAADGRSLRFGMIQKAASQNSATELLLFETLTPGTRISLFRHEDPDAPKQDYIILSSADDHADGDTGSPQITVTQHMAMIAQQPDHVDLFSENKQWDLKVAT